MLNRRFAAASLVASMLGFVPLAAAQAQSRLTIMQSEPPRSMDPADHTAAFTAAVLEPMYDGLVRRDAELKLQPALATEWTVDATGTIWRFSLRQGVKFHDGTPFDAEAVAATFRRHLDPAHGLAASGRIRPILDSVTAIDPATVEFKLKKPYPAFLALLATNPCLIVSPKAAAAGGLGRAAVGTGAYRFVEWKSGEYVREAKNPDYWGDKTGVDELKWSWTQESSVLNMAVQTADADVVNPLPAIFAAGVKANPELKLLQTDGAAVFWVSLNTKLKPLDDVRVRQALNYATNRPQMVQAILSGYGKPANSPLAPAAPGYDAKLDPYAFNLDTARKLLAEAGVADGFALSVAVQEPEAQIAEVLQAMWAKIGVKLEIRRMESGVWAKAAFGTPEQKAVEKLGAVIASWSGGAFNADLQLRPLYATASASPSGANLGFFSDPKLDMVIDAAAAAPDLAQRNALYDEAQTMVNEEAPHVLLYYRADLVATRADISGVWVLPGGEVMAAHAIRRR
jgi:glutathione transport system substrate-binding protein